jgi:penicillin-binding protein 1A
MMQGVCERGTAAKLKELGKPIAGKTGTTNDSKDVWFVGFTPDLVVGVFIGYDNPQPLGAHETGATLAVPIFEEFMQQALRDQPATPFRVPAGLSQVRVDAVTGKLAGEFTKEAIWEAFVPGTEPGEAQTRILDGSMGEGSYHAPRLMPVDQLSGDNPPSNPDTDSTNDGINPEGVEPMEAGTNYQSPLYNAPPPAVSPATNGIY